jgi:chlorophyll synthase
MPPFRFKQNGWLGNAAVGISYEGVAWFTGAAAMLSGFPAWPIVLLAALYSLGAHGIMTLNDFKSVEGDRRMGVASLPAQLGVDAAARVACIVMVLPQVAVIVLLLGWGRPYHACGIVALLAIQIMLMPVLLERPRERAPWYNATGTMLYVIGMLVSAFAVRATPELIP